MKSKIKVYQKSSGQAATVLVPVKESYAVSTLAKVALKLGRSLSATKAYKKSGKIPFHLVSPHRSIFFLNEIEKAVKENPHLASVSHPHISPQKPGTQKKSQLKISCFLRPNRMFIRVWYQYTQFIIPCSRRLYGNNLAIMALVEEVIRFRDEQKKL